MYFEFFKLGDFLLSITSSIPVLKNNSKLVGNLICLGFDICSCISRVYSQNDIEIRFPIIIKHILVENCNDHVKRFMRFPIKLL